MANTAEEITRAVTRRLLSVGLDIVRAFDAARYNERIARHPTLTPIPLFNRQRAFGVLIGNTRVLWPRFLDAFRKRPDLQETSDPLDRHVVEAVQACADRIPRRTLVRFAHDRGHGCVSMLHLAEASGLARVGPAHLAVHPEHGPWFGLRAVIVVDAEPPIAPPPIAPDPCDGCDAPCRRALDLAVGQARSKKRGDIAPSWKAWVAVRDACPVGRGSRYSEAQIRYHYTKDRTALSAAARLSVIEP